MSTILKLPNIQNIPYPESTVPRDVKGAINAIAKIMDIDLVPETPRNEDTLVLLCGVLLYRHIDRFQKMKVMEMLHDSSIIAPVDGAELHDLIVGMLVQPRWHLWSLSTEELASLLAEQEAAVKLLALLGYSVSASTLGAAVSEIIKKKKVGGAAHIFVLTLIAHFTVIKQHGNTKEELDKRTPEPLSSSYY